MESLILFASLLVGRAVAAPAQPAPTPVEKAVQVLSSAKNGMSCAGGVGAGLLDGIQKLGGLVVIRPGQKELARLDGKEIDLSEKIGGVSPRYLAIQLSQKAGELTLAGMPASAEKEFMLLSMSSRSYFEMGGSRLEVAKANIDGTKDQAAADRVTRWMESNMAGYVGDAKAAGRPTLESLIREKEARFAKATCESEEQGLLNEINALKAWKAQADQFAKDESDWLWNHQGTI
jgi:hypothetical protein